MKDLEDPTSRISFVNGDSGTSASNANVEDDYNFTDDQRKAAQELQSLYRKLGLEELDDGYEEGYSAYDDPHYDIVGKLKEVNNRFNEDATPVESDRSRKVRFKESVVDLVVPISPNRSYFGKYNYLDTDDDYGDEVYVDENRNEIDKFYPEDSAADYENEDYNHDDYDYEAFEEPEMENKKAEDDERDEREDIDSKTERSVIGLENEEQYQFVDDDVERSQEDEEDEEDISPDSSAPQKILKLQEEEDSCQDDSKPETDDKSQVSVSSDDNKREMTRVPEETDVVPNATSSTLSNGITKLRVPLIEKTRPRSSVVASSQPLVPGNIKKVQRPTSSISYVSKNIANNGSARPAKPEKCLPTYKGNSRSKYGVPEELKRELRKLKQLEDIQKKLKEHEQNDYRRRKREEAELAFKAWLESKKGYQKTKNDDARGSPKKVHSNEAISEEAFQSWLEQKENQQRKEKFLQQLKELDGNETGISSKSRREQAKRAYRKWLRKKNVQRRQQISLESSPLGLNFSVSTRHNQSLPRALRQVDTLKQTFQAYFGRMTW